MKEKNEDFKFSPKVEKELINYLASKSDPKAKNDFANGIISDLERESYIRSNLADLQAFWSNPPGKEIKPEAKSPKEIEEMLINEIHDLSDDEIAQLESLGF